MEKKAFRVLGIVTRPDKSDHGVLETVNAETPAEAAEMARQRMREAHPDCGVYAYFATPVDQWT
ncbi:hypothetical protein ABZ714_21285 [Streptomyces sp. NPDC006798]|uniref:hypothetical protein n=1 Tax=Streptomyces sp. NPDC006798 TaxID=3155462 RepID=UPI003407B2F7